jgi:hypothetical protein
LIRRQLGNSFGDFFDFHVAQYSTALLSDRKGLAACLLAERAYLLTRGKLKWYASRHVLLSGHADCRFRREGLPMGKYIPSPRDWVREQVELYESSGGTQGTTLRDTGLPVVLVTTGAIRQVRFGRHL